MTDAGAWDYHKLTYKHSAQSSPISIRLRWVNNTICMSIGNVKTETDNHTKNRYHLVVVYKVLQIWFLSLWVRNFQIIRRSDHACMCWTRSESLTSLQHLRTKVYPNLYLTHSKNGRNLVLAYKHDIKR